MVTLNAEGLNAVFADREHDSPMLPNGGTPTAAAQKLWSLDLRAVQIFLTIAAEWSFRRTAYLLRLSPAAVSHAVSGLERHLGVRLFDRSTRVIGLTPDGMALLEPARTLLEAAEALEATACERSGRVTVRVGTMFGLLAGLIEHAASPQVCDGAMGVELTSFGWDDPTCGLRDAEVDVAILAGPTEHDDALVRRTIHHEPVMAIVSSSSPLAVRDTVDLADLDAHGWARVQATDTRWRDWWRLDHVRGGPPPQHPAVHETPASLFFAVRRGHGVGATLAAVRAHFTFDALALVPVRDVDPVPVDVAYRSDRPVPAVERFTRTITALARQTDTPTGPTARRRASACGCVAVPTARAMRDCGGDHCTNAPVGRCSSGT